MEDHGQYTEESLRNGPVAEVRFTSRKCSFICPVVQEKKVVFVNLSTVFVKSVVFRSFECYVHYIEQKSERNFFHLAWYKQNMA